MILAVLFKQKYQPAKDVALAPDAWLQLERDIDDIASTTNDDPLHIISISACGVVLPFGIIKKLF
jgi:hypothetical protein